MLAHISWGHTTQSIMTGKDMAVGWGRKGVGSRKLVSSGTQDKQEIGWPIQLIPIHPSLATKTHLLTVPESSQIAPPAGTKYSSEPYWGIFPIQTTAREYKKFLFLFCLNSNKIFTSV